MSISPSDMPKSGDVLFLDEPVPGIPFPTGYWVVKDISNTELWVGLVEQDEEGMVANPTSYRVDIANLNAFRMTGQRARTHAGQRLED